MDLEKHIESNVDKSETNCWVWRHRKDKKGRPITSGWFKNGDIFKDLEVQRLAIFVGNKKGSWAYNTANFIENCNTLYCCNPDHIEII